MTIANNKIQILASNTRVLNSPTNEWEPTGSAGQPLNGIRCIMKEGGFVEFSQPESAIHLYWPPTSQDRGVRYFKTRITQNAPTASQASVFFGTGSTLSLVEPPKSDPWQVSHTFASNIEMIDIDGPCIISGQAESLGLLA